MSVKNVQGTLLDLTGTPIQGAQVTATCSASIAYNSVGEVIPSSITVTTDSSGVYHFALYANADLTPSGTTYSITAHLYSQAAIAIVVTNAAYDASRPTYFDVVLDGLIVAMPAPSPVQIVAATIGPAYVNGTNVSLGSYALSSLTSGLHNLALGQYALQLDTSGGSNVALGEDSLPVTTTGSLNVAVGVDTLQANTTGSGNTAIGQAALAKTVSGSSSVAVGINALGLSTATGTPTNTAVGSYALAASTTASGLAALGYGALALATTGTNNTAIGSQAGYAPNGVIGNATVIGGSNTFVGFQSGAAANNDPGALTAIGNLAVGNTNSVVIGSNASATGITSVVIGMSASAINGGATVLGFTASVGAVNYGTAIGYGASVTGAGGVAIGIDHTGTSAASATQDLIQLGTSNHSVKTGHTTLDDGSGNGTFANFSATQAQLVYVSDAANSGNYWHLQASGSNTILVARGAASSAEFQTPVVFDALIYPQQHATSGGPAYVKGALYFDTTLNKLRVGGATAWETVTSV